MYLNDLCIATSLSTINNAKGTDSKLSLLDRALEEFKILLCQRQIPSRKNHYLSAMPFREPYATAKLNLCFVRLMLKRLQPLPEMSNGFYKVMIGMSAIADFVK
jgi:hypothetical protein